MLRESIFKASVSLQMQEHLDRTKEIRSKHTATLLTLLNLRLPGLVQLPVQQAHQQIRLSVRICPGRRRLHQKVQLTGREFTFKYANVVRKLCVSVLSLRFLLT